MVTVYLDTSDLSYLLKGRGSAACGDTRSARERLEALIRAERVRLCVSFVHLAEIAVHDETAEAAFAWLEGGAPVWCFTTPAQAIFQAELLGEPLAVEIEPLTRSRIESARVPANDVASVPGSLVAHGLRAVARSYAILDNVGKRTAQRTPGAGKREREQATRETHRLVGRMLRGEHDGVPTPVRWAMAMCLPIIRWGSSRIGLTPLEVYDGHAFPSWFAGTLPPTSWRQAATRARSSPEAAPASALRLAIERQKGSDLRRPTEPGDRFDVEHLAYAARCDFATIDGENFSATRAVRTRLARPLVFPTGRLAEVVAAVERAAG